MPTANDRIQQCYLVDDDVKALDCIKEVVRDPGPESCKPAIVLLVKEGCILCAEEKEKYKHDIADGTIKLVDVTTKEGLEIANRNHVSDLPAVLIVDCNNQFIDVRED